MRGPRYEHILAGTALALILAIPAGVIARDAAKVAGAPVAAAPAESAVTVAAARVAAAPVAAAPVETAPVTPTAPSATMPTEQTSPQPPAAAPVTTVEPAAAPDPMASLDPADRPIAEKIRDIFAAQSDRVFTGKKERAAAEAADVLVTVADAADVSKALDGFSPPNEAYQKLKAALAELRASGTAKASHHQIETIIANMERWRWYARDLGEAHVVVNQPDFTLKVMHHGGQVWTTRIVIGKPSMATPLLSETMKFITVNPTWHVPPSIVHNEYL